jgi:inorganic pyrophosphatase
MQRAHTTGGVGIMLVKSASSTEDPLNAMKRGYLAAAALACVCFAATTRLMLYCPEAPSAWFYYTGCGLVGIVTSYLLVLITQYYTDYKHAPVIRIADASKTGSGTNVIAGIGVGMESTGPPILVICTALLVSYALGMNSGMWRRRTNAHCSCDAICDAICYAAHSVHVTLTITHVCICLRFCLFKTGLPGVGAGIFGTAVATMGMLCTAVFILSMNNFGPIADNAGGIVEMSGQPEAVRVITDRLDAVGNVTKAATKGYAVGGSALACFVLFQVGSIMHVDFVFWSCSCYQTLTLLFFSLASSLALPGVSRRDE